VLQAIFFETQVQVICDRMFTPVINCYSILIKIDGNYPSLPYPATCAFKDRR